MRSASSAAASPAAAFEPPPLRARERTLLRSLLRPSPQLSPLLISGPAQSGKREVVLGVLAECGALFAYSSGRTAHVDKRWISRVTDQITRRKEAQAEEAAEANGGLNATPGKGRAGRKKRKLGGAGASAVAAIVDLTDEVDDDAIHPPSESAGQKRKSDAGSASATAAASAMSLEAAAAAALTSTPRAQLVDLVRTVVGLRVAHEKLHLAAVAAGTAAAGSAPPVPPTLFLVFSEPARIQAAHPGLFASLLEMTSHTGYPVTLVLLHRSISGDCATDGAASLWGMTDAHASSFMRLTFAPYTAEQKAQILSDRLWSTHESFAEANLALITAVSRLSATQAASTAYAAWTSFCAMVLPVFQGAMVGGGPLRDYETVLRQIVPPYLEALERRTKNAMNRGGGGAGATKIEPAELSASLLGELRPVVQSLMGSLMQNQSGLALTQASSAAGGRSSHPARYSLLAPMASSPAASAAASAAPAAPLTPFPDLCRTSRLLLMASFLGSYNPASADRTRFIHGRSTKSNRRGKSATMERAGSGIGKSSAAQVSQLSLGPQWVSLDRLLAIFHVLNQDEAGSDSAEDGAQQINEEAGDLAAYEQALARQSKEDPKAVAPGAQSSHSLDPSSSSSSVGRFSQSSCFQLLSSLCAAFALECTSSSSTAGSFAAASSTAGTLGVAAKIASGSAGTSAASAAASGWGSGSTSANGDMLASMRVRCLLSYEQVSAIIAAGSSSKAKSAEEAAGRAAPSGSGSTLSLDAYLYDQTTANGRGRSSSSKQRATK